MIAEEKAEHYRVTMEAAAFTAWQITNKIAAKKEWTKYQKAIGVAPIDKDKIGASEKEEILKTSESIHERVLRLQKNGR